MERPGPPALALENDEVAWALPAVFGHRPPTESDFGYQRRRSRSSFVPMLTEMPPELDRETCDRARFARDAAYDGLFFVGVRTTRIYCRPVCPARPAKSENVMFFPTAAAAERAGFRPCLRCRPETAPGSPAWTGTATTVARGMRLIEEGFLDRASVEELAGKLGIGPRHLLRLFLRHAGATPSEVAAGIVAIRNHAAEVGRAIPEDHYGVLVPYVFASDSHEALKIAGPSIRRRQDIPPSDYSALGTPDQVRRKIQEYIDAGATKFVMRPYGPKETHVEQVHILAEEVISPLQTPFSPAERVERLG